MVFMVVFVGFGSSLLSVVKCAMCLHQHLGGSSGAAAVVHAIARQEEARAPDFNGASVRNR